MLLTTWNVNSIRTRLDLVLEFIDAEQPDVVALQETRCSDSQFPFAAFTDVGFEVVHNGVGGHGGVALASRAGLERVSWGFSGEHGAPFDEPRLLAADVGDLRVFTVYAPNGRRVGSAAWQFKLAWFELLRVELEQELAEQPQLVVCGDFNVCPADIDVYDPVRKRGRNLVSAAERAALSSLQDLGLDDAARALHPDEPGFTWFSHSPEQLERNRGYRLDLVLAPPAIVDRLTGCRPAIAWRQPERHPSDHAPVLAHFAEPLAAE